MKRLGDLTNDELMAELQRRLAGDEPDPNRDAGKLLARQWVRLYDEQQADFFEEAGRIMFDTWDFGVGNGQLYAIARHMARCKCITPERGHRLLEDLLDALQRAKLAAAATEAA